MLLNVLKISQNANVSENSSSKNFVNFQEKHPGEIAFSAICRLSDTYWECSTRKFMKFSEQASKETPANASLCN